MLIDARLRDLTNTFAHPPSASASPTLPPVSDAELSVLQPSIITLGGDPADAAIDSALQVGGSFHFMQESELEGGPIPTSGLKFGDVEVLETAVEGEVPSLETSQRDWVKLDSGHSAETITVPEQQEQETPPVSLFRYLFTMFASNLP